MGLNFGGMLAGVSQSVVRRIEEEEDRLEEIAKEERSLATRQRAAREAERRKKQAIVDEYTGLLKMYGMNDDTIGEIAGYGSTAMQTAAGHAETVFKAGGDINTVYKYNPNKNPTSTDTSKLVEQTTAALQTDLAEDVPALTTGVADTKKTETIKATGLTIDQDALKNFFPMKAEYGSVGAMEAGLLNLRYQARKRGDTDKENEYDAQLQDLYQHKKDLADAGREEGKDTTSFHTPSSATSLFNTMQRTAGDLIGVEQGELGQITSDLKGDPMPSPLRDYIATSNMMTSAEGDKAVQRLASGINNTSTGLIKNAARVKASKFQGTDQFRNKTSDPSGKTTTDGVRYFNFGQFDASAFTPDQFGPQEANFKLGDSIVIQDDNGALRLMVYTGVPNPLLNGSKYIVVQ